MYFSKKRIYGFVADTGIYALQSVRNDLQMKDISSISIFVEILLPENMNKKQGYEMEKCIKKEAKRNRVNVLETFIYSDPHVLVPCVEILAVGEMNNDKQDDKQQNELKDILLIGNIGLEGTLRTISEKEDELKKRFSLSFLEEIKRKRSTLDIKKTIEVLKACELEYDLQMFSQVGDGGVFKTLWDLTLAKKCGFEVFMKKIPVLQETIEICECFRMNPYRLASAGCLLVLCADGEGLVEALEESGIKASFVGTITAKNDKVIKNGEEIRYLDRPVADEMKIILS